MTPTDRETVEALAHRISEEYRAVYINLEKHPTLRTLLSERDEVIQKYSDQSDKYVALADERNALKVENQRLRASLRETLDAHNAPHTLASKEEGNG